MMRRFWENWITRPLLKGLTIGVLIGGGLAFLFFLQHEQLVSIVEKQIGTAEVLGPAVIFRAPDRCQSQALPDNTGFVIRCQGNLTWSVTVDASAPETSGERGRRR